MVRSTAVYRAAFGTSPQFRKHFRGVSNLLFRSLRRVFLISSDLHGQLENRIDNADLCAIPSALS
jgi:hypothetical protein